jgi:chemotaxis response regulator CheB
MAMALMLHLEANGTATMTQRSASSAVSGELDGAASDGSVQEQHYRQQPG